MIWGRFKREAGKKYGNKKVEHRGHWFDSKLEAAVFDLLSLRQAGGEIRDLASQPGTVFLSEARIQYRPDFRWTNAKTGEVEYGEAKGYPNQKWPIVKKLWRSYGFGRLEIWMGNARSPKLIEIIIPVRKV